MRYIDRHRAHARSRIAGRSAVAAGETGDPAAPNGFAEASEHPYAIFRNRDFTLYLTGRLVAVLGQQMFAMALGWEIYDTAPYSALALGLVGLTQMIPMFLFTLPAGHVADNYNRKRIMVLMTAVIAAASLGVAVISALQAPVYWIYLCLFIGGTARTFIVGGQRRLSAGAGGPEGFPARGELERRRVSTVLHRRPGGGRRHHRLDGPASSASPGGAGLCASMRWRRWSFAFSSAWSASNTPSPSRNP